MICTAMDLDLVIVGGGVALGFAATFFNAAQEEIDAVARVGQGAAARITPVRLGDRGALIGAGALGLRGLRRAESPEFVVARAGRRRSDLARLSRMTKIRSRDARAASRTDAVRARWRRADCRVVSATCSTAGSAAAWRTRRWARCPGGLGGMGGLLKGGGGLVMLLVIGAVFILPKVLGVAGWAPPHPGGQTGATCRAPTARGGHRRAVRAGRASSELEQVLCGATERRVRVLDRPAAAVVRCRLRRHAAPSSSPDTPTPVAARRHRRPDRSTARSTASSTSISTSCHAPEPVRRDR